MNHSIDSLLDGAGDLLPDPECEALNGVILPPYWVLFCSVLLFQCLDLVFERCWHRVHARACPHTEVTVHGCCKCTLECGPDCSACRPLQACCLCCHFVAPDEDGYVLHVDDNYLLVVAQTWYSIFTVPSDATRWHQYETIGVHIFNSSYSSICMAGGLALVVALRNKILQKPDALKFEGIVLATNDPTRMGGAVNGPSSSPGSTPASASAASTVSNAAAVQAVQAAAAKSSGVSQLAIASAAQFATAHAAAAPVEPEPVSSTTREISFGIAIILCIGITVVNVISAALATPIILSLFFTTSHIAPIAFAYVWISVIVFVLFWSVMWFIYRIQTAYGNTLGCVYVGRVLLKLAITFVGTLYFASMYNYSLLMYSRQFSYAQVIAHEWTIRNTHCYFNALSTTTTQIVHFVGLF